MSFKASVGTNSPAKFPEYLGSAQYAELYNEARMNMGVDPSSPDLFSTNVIEDFKMGKDIIGIILIMLSNQVFSRIIVCLSEAAPNAPVTM